MAERPKLDLGLTGYDELFMTDSERQQNKLPRIHDVPLELIDDFPGHPFKVRMDEDMQQLVDSIKERGVLTPITLREKMTADMNSCLDTVERKLANWQDSLQSVPIFAT